MENGPEGKKEYKKKNQEWFEKNREFLREVVPMAITSSFIGYIMTEKSSDWRIGASLGMAAFFFGLAVAIYRKSNGKPDDYTEGQDE